MRGKPLHSHQACFWKVRVWDKGGAPSAWSKPARWSIGLLDQAEWKAAAWIGSDRSRQVEQPSAHFEGAKWVWHAGDKGSNKPQGRRLFVTGLRLPAGSKVEKAELLVTADDFFHFTINGNEVTSGQPGSGGWSQPKFADVTSHIKPAPRIPFAWRSITVRPGPPVSSPS